MERINNTAILALLDTLDSHIADDLETQWLEFKPWIDPKVSLREAVEYAACFANADGGVVVFGVSDRVRGRKSAVHGAKGYDLDMWSKGIFSNTRPNLKVDVEELPVPEGTGKLLLVRVPKGPSPPYGTSSGLFKSRVGKNCMPLDGSALMKSRVSSGSVDWSGETCDLAASDLDPVEIARARNILSRFHPESEFLGLQDAQFLQALGAVKNGHVTHAGLLLFGKSDQILDLCPQHQLHYVFQTSETTVARNDSYRQGILGILEVIENIFTGPENPEREVSDGLFKIRIPTYPIEVVREAVLNAITHRDYSDPGEILIRHARRELVITSPGGFIGGITPENILRSEPISRNRTLAEVFQKLHLVERAGMGRRRIYLPTLSYGKRPPVYETDGSRVTLRIFDGVFDAKMATLVAKWKKEGIEIGVDGLLVLFYLREHDYIDAAKAGLVLQLSREEAARVLHQLTQLPKAVLERRGKTKSVTYHLTKPVASDLLGKAAYTESKGISPLRYAEMVKSYLQDHGSITPRLCRDVLHLGESQSARVEISRLLKKWSGSEGFLRREGKPPHVSYFLKQ